MWDLMLQRGEPRHGLKLCKWGCKCKRKVLLLLNDDFRTQNTYNTNKQLNEEVLMIQIFLTLISHWSVVSDTVLWLVESSYVKYVSLVVITMWTILAAICWDLKPPPSGHEILNFNFSEFLSRIENIWPILQNRNENRIPGIMLIWWKLYFFSVSLINICFIPVWDK